MGPYLPNKDTSPNLIPNRIPNLIRSMTSRNPCLMQQEAIEGHWPTMGRASEGKLRAKLDFGESLTPLPPKGDTPVIIKVK